MVDPGTPHTPGNTASDGNSPTAIRWMILGLLMAYAGMVHFNRLSISVAGTEHIIPDYDLSPTQMGTVYSAYLFVYTLFMMPGGWLIDRFGPKKALMLLGFGSAILVPVTGLTGFAAPAVILPLLCGVRGLLGMLSAPIHPGAARAASFWLPYSSRGKANGMITGAALLGITATPGLFGYLMDTLTWPFAFVFAGGLTLIVAIVWTVLSTDHPAQHRWCNRAEVELIEAGDLSKVLLDSSAAADQPGVLPVAGPLGWLRRNLSLVMLTTSYACYSYFQYLFFYWMQFYFDTVLKLGKEDGRTYATITYLAMAAGMMSGGWLIDALQARWRGWSGRAIPPIFGMVASAVFVLLGISTENPQLVVTCFALSMAALGMCEAPFWVTAVELGRHRGGTSAATLNTIGNAGGILAPIITPLFSSYFGWKAGLCLAAGVVVLGAVFWWWVDPYEGQVVGSAE